MYAGGTGTYETRNGINWGKHAPVKFAYISMKLPIYSYISAFKDALVYFINISNFCLKLTPTLLLNPLLQGYISAVTLKIST